MAKKILIFRSNDTDLLQPPVKQSTKLSVYQFMATRTKQVFNALLSYNFVAASCAPHQVVHTVHPHKPRHQLCILKTVASSCCLLWRLLKLANLTYAVEFRNEPGSPLTFWSQCQARGYAWRIFFYPWIVAVNYSISPSTSTPNVFSRPLMYVFFIVIWRENVSVVIRQTHEKVASDDRANHTATWSPCLANAKALRIIWAFQGFPHFWYISSLLAGDIGRYVIGHLAACAP